MGLLETAASYHCWDARNVMDGMISPSMVTLLRSSVGISYMRRMRPPGWSQPLASSPRVLSCGRWAAWVSGALAAGLKAARVWCEAVVYADRYLISPSKHWDRLVEANTPSEALPCEQRVKQVPAWLGLRSPLTLDPIIQLFVAKAVTDLKLEPLVKIFADAARIRG